MKNKVKKTKGWSTKFHMTMGLVALGILVGGFGTWAATMEITGAVISSGKVEVDRNRQVVQHLDGGVVKEIFVEEGQTIEKDGLLLRLDPAERQSELTVVENQLFELLARTARLQAERDSLDSLTFHALLEEQDSEEVAELMAGQKRLF